jgi:hypothetical protein
MLETLSIHYGPQDDALDLSRRLQQFRVHLKKLETKTSTQSKLDRWLRKD